MATTEFEPKPTLVGDKLLLDYTLPVGQGVYLGRMAFHRALLRSCRSFNVRLGSTYIQQMESFNIFYKKYEEILKDSMNTVGSLGFMDESVFRGIGSFVLREPLHIEMILEFGTSKDRLNVLDSEWTLLSHYDPNDPDVTEEIVTCCSDARVLHGKKQKGNYVYKPDGPC
jgi:hypothetical protein